MRNKEEVQYAYSLASRFQPIKDQLSEMSQDEVLKSVLTGAEYSALQKLRHPKDSPFAAVWANGSFAWDGILEAKKFWKQLPGKEQNDWHMK